MAERGDGGTGKRWNMESWNEEMTKHGTVERNRTRNDRTGNEVERGPTERWNGGTAERTKKAKGEGIFNDAITRSSYS